MIKYDDCNGRRWCQCDECRAGTTVYIGQEEDFEARFLYLCRECLVKALEVLDKGVEDETRKEDN